MSHLTIGLNVTVMSLHDQLWMVCGARLRDQREYQRKPGSQHAFVSLQLQERSISHSDTVAQSIFNHACHVCTHFGMSSVNRAQLLLAPHIKVSKPKVRKAV